MFFKAHTDVLESNLSAHEKLILIAIESWNDDRDCIYGAERLARYASCCVRTAKTVTAALEKKGLITITPRTGDTNIYKAVSSVADILRNAAPVQELHAPRANAARPPVQELHPTRATVAPNKNINKINDKIIDKIIVADAPLPTEPELKDSLIDLELLKEPLETLEEPESFGVTQPPQVPLPPLPEPHRFLAAELSAEHRAKLLAQIKSPAQRAGLDAEKLLNEQLAACERWSHKDNKKDKFRDCWLATLQRQWIGKKIKELAENPKKPAGPSGLTYLQVETIFRDFWNEAHGLSRLDCSFVTKDQEPFIEKTYKTFAKNEDDFLEFLRKQDPHQFNKQWVQIWMVFKQIESEAAK
jgi:hypothetical protein